MGEIIFQSFANFAFFLILIWRIETIREDIRRDVAGIEREVYLNETDTIELFGNGAEK